MLKLKLKKSIGIGMFNMPLEELPTRVVQLSKFRIDWWRTKGETMVISGFGIEIFNVPLEEVPTSCCTTIKFKNGWGGQGGGVIVISAI